MVAANQALIKQPVPPDAKETRVVMQGVSWQTFKALMREVRDDRAWRIAYEEGVLEIRMPLLEHEVPKGLLESFVEAIADELEIEVFKAGSLTLEREDLTKAIEPDSCFYIQNELQVRGKEQIAQRSANQVSKSAKAVKSNRLSLRSSRTGSGKVERCDFISGDSSCPNRRFNWRVTRAIRLLPANLLFCLIHDRQHRCCHCYKERSHISQLIEINPMDLLAIK
jgi:hypothetical protein